MEFSTCDFSSGVEKTIITFIHCGLYDSITAKSSCCHIFIISWIAMSNLVSKLKTIMTHYVTLHFFVLEGEQPN